MEFRRVWHYANPLELDSRYLRYVISGFIGLSILGYATLAAIDIRRGDYEKAREAATAGVGGAAAGLLITYMHNRVVKGGDE